MNLFQSALHRVNVGRPPVWFMRQAGRYHSQYQRLREQHSFVDLCKKPEIACEATMGPIRDFGFDAAILFSDLLFPLESMGMGLSYEPGPTLSWHLREVSDLKKIRHGQVSSLDFQAEAMRLIRHELDPAKGLLGFVGGPLTLFCYAVEGSHSGELKSARAGLRDGRFEGFCERLLDLLAGNMALQGKSGADCVAVLDTCAGEFTPAEYGELVVPVLERLLDKYAALCPEVPAFYYSKGTGPEHWEFLRKLKMSGLGVDWNHEMADVLTQWGDLWAIQGNVDPNWLFLERAELERRLRGVFTRVLKLPSALRQGWICGLGHGVLPKTPEDNVRLFIRVQREMFGGK